MELIVTQSFQHALSELSAHVPEASLENVVGYCGKVLRPLCDYVGSSVRADVEDVVRAMQHADLEQSARLASLEVSLVNQSHTCARLILTLL